MGPANLHRDLTASALADALGPSREIWVSGCSAEIAGLPDLLDEGGITGRISGIISPLLNTRSYASPDLGRRARTFFLNKELRTHLAEGHVDLCPWTYTQIMAWLQGPLPVDAAIVMVSPPDANGNVSLGTQCDFLPLFHQRLPRLIAVINPHMPYTLGDNLIPLVRFSAVFEQSQPLLSLSHRASAADPQIDRIATNIANLIPDGATIQCGIGRIPQAVFSKMRDHRGIKVQSGLVDDDILLLEDLGVLDQARAIRTAVAMGSDALYQRVAHNPRFHFCATDQTHTIAALSAATDFRSINAALQVDLFGQVCAEMVDGRLIAMPGGFPDFVRGAGTAPNARSIIAVQAGAGTKTKPGIVASLSQPAQVTATKTEVDTIVTEFGTAHLRELSMDQRAEALIAIAAPQDQNSLSEAWAQMRNTALGRR